MKDKVKKRSNGHQKDVPTSSAHRQKLEDLFAANAQKQEGIDLAGPSTGVPKKNQRGAPWKKGQSGNPDGGKVSERATIQQAKLRIMARTGMLPLDFMTAVYRNELYEDYDQKVAEDGRTVFFSPKADSPRIDCPLNIRLQAAQTAAYYVHKRMPVGIEVSGKQSQGITADALAKLSTKELFEMMRMMDKIGLTLELGAADPGRVVDQQGNVLPALPGGVDPQ